MSYHRRPYSSNRRPRPEPKLEVYIEYPSRGATYSKDEYGVYEYGECPRSSVLAGQQRRVFLDSFQTLDEAKAAYPSATVSASCCVRARHDAHAERRRAHGVRR